MSNLTRQPARTPTGTLLDYRSTFVQGWPSYITKSIGKKKWTTFNASKIPLNDIMLQRHLDGKIAIGTPGKWYPGHCLIDFDDIDFRRVEEIRDAMGMNDCNSMICTSESVDSYHLIFRPTYQRKPPTLRLLNDIMQPFAREHGIEMYPQPKKPCRLPFSKIQTILSEDGFLTDTWQQKLYWFNKLDEYDLYKVPHHQQVLDLDIPGRTNKVSASTIGQQLYEHGLQEPSSRHDGQFHVLYYLWRKNMPLDAAIAETFRWIKTKHNGKSKDITNLRQVYAEIKRQAIRIYTKYTYPDEAHNTHFGYLTKPDIVDVLHYTDASLPKARALFFLVKYFYPRRLRPQVTVHSDLLVRWSSRDTYQARLREWADMGIVKQGDKYVVGKKAKELVLTWNYRHPESAILVDERAPETLEETLAASYEPEELRALLKQAGMDRRNTSPYLKRVFEPTRDRMSEPIHKQGQGCVEARLS